MENQIEDFLMDQFEGLGNEWDETIESFEISDTDIVIETWISWSIDISDYIHLYDDVDELKRSIEEELEECETLSLLGEDYVCGFYCHFFEDLSPHDYLQNCDIVVNRNENRAIIYLPMDYIMDRNIIESMYSNYKRSA